MHRLATALELHDQVVHLENHFAGGAVGPGATAWQSDPVAVSLMAPSRLRMPDVDPSPSTAGAIGLRSRRPRRRGRAVETEAETGAETSRTEPWRPR